MSRIKSKSELIEEITKERRLLEELLDAIPDKLKTEEVTDGMSVKDFIAHRAEWGRMMIRWYDDAKAGKQPAVPTKEYKWNQLKELNASIHAKYANKALLSVMKDFAAVHDRLLVLVKKMRDDELFDQRFYAFTGTSDLATYVNSATASHYRSARRHIQRWWKKRMGNGQ